MVPSTRVSRSALTSLGEPSEALDSDSRLDENAMRYDTAPMRLQLEERSMLNYINLN